MTWAAQQQVPGVGTDSLPALAVWKDKLWMAWKGVHGDGSIYWNSFDGQSRSSQQLVPGTGAFCGPGLAGFNEKLYMVYCPGVSDPMLWTSYDGTSWATPGYVRDPNPNDPSPSGIWNPALVVWPVTQQLRMIFSDGSLVADNYIYWSELSGGAWGHAFRLASNRTGRGPAAAVFRGLLYCAWKGMALEDEGIYWVTFDRTFGQLSWLVVPGVGTTNAPALAVLGDQVYMAWKGGKAGLDDDEGIYWATFDGTAWSPQQRVSFAGTTVGPALAVYKNRLYMAWKGGQAGLDDDESIWYSYLT